MLYTLQHGGSGRGISSVHGYTRCPQSALLKKQGSDSRPFSETKPSLQIGTLFHAYQEAWQEEYDITEWSDEPDEGALLEAQRLMAWYQEHFDKDWCGKVIGTEIQLEGPKVDEAVGMKGFTCRIDAIAVIPESKCKEINNPSLSPKITRTFGTVTPGLWVVDYKTSSREDTNIIQFRNSLQYVAYCLAVRTHFENVKGIIFDTTFKTKEPKNVRYVFPFPSEERILALHRYLEMAAYIAKDPVLRDWKNLGNCWGCPWIENGCDQVNGDVNDRLGIIG